VQTVDADTNPRFHRLLTEFKRLTGCPVLVNTSFNVRGRADRMLAGGRLPCLMGTDIEMLVIGNCVLYKIGKIPSFY